MLRGTLESAMDASYVFRVSFRLDPDGATVDPDAFWPAFHAEEDPITRAEATYLHDDAASIRSSAVPTRPAGSPTQHP